MKKIMTAMLGLSLILGATSVAFGQSTTTKTTKAKKTKKTTSTAKM
jgi:hypothetical protein